MHEKKMSTIGWGIFFLWLGIALFTKLQLSTSLIGAGVIMLGIQVARKIYGMKVELFWILAGALFVLFNLFNIPKVNIPITPIILVVFGLIFIITALKKRQ